MTRLIHVLTLVLALSAPSAFAQSTPDPTTGDAAETTRSEEALERHVGGYQLQPGMVLSITRDAGSLFSGIADQVPYEMLPGIDGGFMILAIGAEITFNQAPDGSTESLTLNQSGMTIVADRVE